MSGEGMRKEDLTLALFSDSDLVKRYLEFKKFRSGNYNTYTKNFSSFCCLLTDAKYGFLTQQPAYADKMKQPSAHHNFFFDDEEENDIRSIHLGKPLREYWKQWCTGNYKDLNAAVREFAVRGQFPMTRDPEEPIRAILALKRPMDALMLLIARMDDNPPAPTWRNRCQAVYLRDRCILALLTSNPLRVKHFKIMTYRKDNSGNLYKTEDGRWRLRFKSSDFKNENGAAKDDYDVGVPEWVWPYVEEYLKWRQHLKCPDATDHLFLVAPNGSNKHRESGEFITSQKISAIVARRTYDHIPEYAPAGFRAHAFRHIIATDYLKNNRGEFHIVAHILHDTLEMVLRKYAKFKVGEGIEIYGEYQARMREEFFKKRKMGENK
jgi:integrase